MKNSKIPPRVPVDLNKNKNQVTKEKGNFQKYGIRSNTNVKWVYDFAPLRNGLIVLILSATIGYFLSQWNEERMERQYAEETRIAAEAARKKYLENMLEELKQKTIDEEKRKALGRY